MNKAIHTLRNQLTRNWMHLVAVALFVLISSLFFPNAFQGKTYQMPDIVGHKGMSQEIKAHRQFYGEEPLWTNSMYGGMPAVQVSQVHSGNFLSHLPKILSLGLPHPVNLLFLYMMGIYILFCTLRVNPWVGMIGAVCYGLGTYLLIIIEAGHTSKAMTVAFAPIMLSGMLMVFRKQWWVGVATFSLGTALCLTANHPQVTYYFGFLMLGTYLFFLFRDVKSKQLRSHVTAVGLLFAGLGLSVGANYSVLQQTAEYTEQSVRGKQFLTSDQGEESDGLDYDKVTRWSYAQDETFSLLVPNIKGGESGTYLHSAQNEDGELCRSLDIDTVKRAYGESPCDLVLESNTYFGKQPGSHAGPVYLGAIVMFLFVLGFVYVKHPFRWVLLGVGLFTIMLSWGGNMPLLTKPMVEYFPFYAKFRAITIILVVSGLCLVTLAFWTLDRILSGEGLKTRSTRPLMVILGGFCLMLLILIIWPGVFPLLSPNETAIMEQLASNGYPMDEVQRGLSEIRSSVVRQDAMRSLFLVLFTGLALWAFFTHRIRNRWIVLGAIGLLSVVELFEVGKRYLGDHGAHQAVWVEEFESLLPYLAEVTDLEILERERAAAPTVDAAVHSAQDSIHALVKEGEIPEDAAQRYLERVSFDQLNRLTDFRVWDSAEHWSSSRTSYFHKSLSGYHGAPLRRFDDITSHGLFQKNPKLLDMFNVKYLTANDTVVVNQSALGSAWCVENIDWAEDAQGEFDALQTLEPATTAVLHMEFEGQVTSSPSGSGTLSMTNYRANRITYDFQSENDELVVFSQVWYPHGWKLYMDGESIPLVRANYVLRAAQIPAGHHELVMVYESETFQHASIVSMLGSGVLLGFCVVVLLSSLRRAWRRASTTPINGAS